MRQVAATGGFWHDAVAIAAAIQCELDYERVGVGCPRQNKLTIYYPQARL